MMGSMFAMRLCLMGDGSAVGLLRIEMGDHLLFWSATKRIIVVSPRRLLSLSL